jgi:hypothetical protein
MRFVAALSFLWIESWQTLRRDASEVPTEPITELRLIMQTGETDQTSNKNQQCCRPSSFR